MKTLKFFRPAVISAAAVLLLFFIMQGIPMARTLYRRTDLVSAVVVQDGRRAELTVGVLGDNIFYDGKWYTGAASTPELFRNLTYVRFFEEREEEG